MGKVAGQRPDGGGTVHGPIVVRRPLIRHVARQLPLREALGFSTHTFYAALSRPAVMAAASRT